MGCSNKIDLPLKRTMVLLHMISHICFLVTGNAIKLRKLDIKGVSPCQVSTQNLVRAPLPTLKPINLSNFSQPLLICFQRLTPYGPLTTLVDQPNPKTHFPFITLLHKASLSKPNLHSHFPGRASMKTLKLRTAGQLSPHSDKGSK